MKQIRRGVFETNSSSTHSITMCPESEFAKWENDEVLFLGSAYSSSSEYKEKTFITTNELRDILSHNRYYDGVPVDELTDEDLYSVCKDSWIEVFTHSDYFNDDDMDSYSEKYTTPGGETIVAFGQYGYD